MHDTKGRGFASVAAQLLAAGADPEVADHNGSTPMHLACGLRVTRTCRSDRVVAMLLAAGVDPNARNGIGVTPLMICRANSNLGALARCLLDAGADPTAEDGRSAR